jgi:hypothetical protein
MVDHGRCIRFAETHSRIMNRAVALARRITRRDIALVLELHNLVGLPPGGRVFEVEAGPVLAWTPLPRSGDRQRGDDTTPGRAARGDDPDPQPSGLPSSRRRPSRPPSPSPPPRSGMAMFIAGRLSRGCACAKSAWAGTCPAFSTPRPAIPGRLWWRWLTGYSSWPAPSWKTRPCPGRDRRRA